VIYIADRDLKPELLSLFLDACLVASAIFRNNPGSCCFPSARSSVLALTKTLQTCDWGIVVRIEQFSVAGALIPLFETGLGSH
jgi:hypothetical protein